MSNDKPIKLIYIIGMSFSGSTLLGFLLGSGKEVENLGQLKTFSRRQISRTCTCGDAPLVCSLWGKYYDGNYQTFDKPSVFAKIRMISNILLKKKEGVKQLTDTPDLTFLKAIHDDIQSFNSQINYLVDTSNSIWRLAYLLQCQGIELKVIYLKREVNSNIVSFMKRNRLLGFWRGIFTYKIKHYLISKFLAINQVPNVSVSYEEICAIPQKTLSRIGIFLNINYDNFSTHIRQRQYHVIGGNRDTSKQFRDGFQGVENKNVPKEKFNSLQSFILKYFG
ncbi:MAG: hypothetical protein R3E32_18280 [Chitinophagales bacterium]